MVPVQDRPAPTDVRDQQIGVGILVVRGVELRDRPRLGHWRGRRHSLMPFEGPRQSCVLAEEDNVVVTAHARRSAPLHAGKTHQPIVLVGVGARQDDIGPHVIGDLKVVGGVALSLIHI